MEEKIIVPPIKCQGIKTKLIPFLRENIKFDSNATWIEPFVGTGVVVFNIKPEHAILIDKNKYIIDFYNKIQQGIITPKIVREFLEYHGKMLEIGGADYYKKMRDSFNINGDPLYFLFLNRSDFNGMIRFNKNGKFNVPFCKKPNRFSKSYITKICNQVEHVAQIMKDKDWKFICCNWEKAFDFAKEKDFIYLDPPYVGRDTCYVGEWPIEEAIELAKKSHETQANVCLSMWKENEFRKNDYLYKYWSDYVWKEVQHFYHIGASEKNRHPMIEVAAFKK